MKKEHTLVTESSGTFGQRALQKYDTDKVLFTFNKSFIKKALNLTLSIWILKKQLI